MNFICYFFFFVLVAHFTVLRQGTCQLWSCLTMASVYMDIVCVFRETTFSSGIAVSAPYGPLSVYRIA